MRILYWISESDNLFSHFKKSYSKSRQSLFPILRKVMKMKHFHFHVNVNVHRTISNLSLSCLCIQRKEFSIGNVNANVYVNLFLFHLRSEVLIIEGYYTKYPNPTPTISFPHFKESYETFSFSCWILYWISESDNLFFHFKKKLFQIRQSLFSILRKVMKHFHFHVNVHCTIPNLSLSCPCIQRIFLHHRQS